jgi:hypothetical protein
MGITTTDTIIITSMGTSMIIRRITIMCTIIASRGARRSCRQTQSVIARLDRAIQ